MSVLVAPRKASGAVTPDNRIPQVIVIDFLRPEYGRVPTAMGPGFERAGTALELQQPSDEGDTNQEPTSDLAQRAVTAVNRIENPPAEILRIGFHDSPPHRDLPSNRVPSKC